ncbi:nucleotide exchange factor GrpE [Chitinasiproducens palmae]|uniref:Protein GrpE n=1 Tax=Chitinasiproducens palmae TaxID=1770053 RepID=A0A1H2PRC7_9BURK|nr:nucleotide exchange factor GrpE [Chitinasiproducens palmae]SDV49460.1 molecular chaperone GrpE [Chitinasiproducens palmae]
MEDKQSSQSNSPEDTEGLAAEAVPTEASAGEAPAAADDLDARLAEAQAEAAQWKEELLRAKAEVENVRRRAQDEVAKARKFAIESLAEQLVPVVDSLEAARADQSGDIAKLREGVELTARQLTQALERGQILAVSPAVGEKFDPHRHQAIASVPTEQEANTVVTVLQKGYTIFERVLRPALVTVSAPK